MTMADVSRIGSCRECIQVHWTFAPGGSIICIAGVMILQGAEAGDLFTSRCWRPRLGRVLRRSAEATLAVKEIDHDGPDPVLSD
jgi:hypothetical protein